MSVQRHNIADGTRWKVRWRQAGGVMRARSFTSKQEAIAFDADVKARKYKGETMPRAHRETIAGQVALKSVSMRQYAIVRVYRDRAHGSH